MYDHINNEELLSSDTLASMLSLAQGKDSTSSCSKPNTNNLIAMAARDYGTAHSIHLDLVTHKTEECTNWMTGVKRLIDMSRVTP